MGRKTNEMKKAEEILETLQNSNICISEYYEFKNEFIRLKPKLDNEFLNQSLEIFKRYHPCRKLMPSAFEHNGKLHVFSFTFEDEDLELYKDKFLKLFKDFYGEAEYKKMIYYRSILNKDN